MKIYFVRHAPTSCNLTGQMVAGYENTDIINIKPENWENKVGIYIPESARKCIISSPAKRCVQTSDLLFKRIPDSIYRPLDEFDCKALGDKKFWEISEEEFNKIVRLSPAGMTDKIKKIFETARYVKEEYRTNECVAISHGMVIRYLWHYMNNHKYISAYDVINSKGFAFANLDLLIVDTSKMTVEVHNFKDPINHKT